MELLVDAESILKQAKEIWDLDPSLEPPAQIRARIRACAEQSCKQEEHQSAYADTCECFYLFRAMHAHAEDAPGGAVLAGDYFFSRFSHALIVLDSVQLTNLFSGFLKQNTEKKSYQFPLEQYLEFIQKSAQETSL